MKGLTLRRLKLRSCFLGIYKRSDIKVVKVTEFRVQWYIFIDLDLVLVLSKNTLILFI